MDSDNRNGISSRKESESRLGCVDSFCLGRCHRKRSPGDHDRPNMVGASVPTCNNAPSPSPSRSSRRPRNTSSPHHRHQTDFSSMETTERRYGRGSNGLLPLWWHPGSNLSQCRGNPGRLVRRSVRPERRSIQCRLIFLYILDRPIRTNLAQIPPPGGVRFASLSDISWARLMSWSSCSNSSILIMRSRGVGMP